MLKSNPSRWFCLGNPFFEELDLGLPGGYSIQLSTGTRVCGQLLDTFNGHLRRSAKLLVQLPQQVVLIDLAEGSMVEQPASKGWKFAAELNDGEVGNQLMECSRLRAFVPVCEVQVERRNLSMADELGKTVVRAGITVATVEGHSATWLAARPLRGYAEECGRLGSALSGAGFNPFSEASDIFPMPGMERPLYDSKPVMTLDPQAPVFESACSMVRVFLEVAVRNEAGIRADTDTEFLHDYRVSLRRVRSLIGLLKGVFGEKDRRMLKQELAAVMQQTNALRDYDVYQLDRESFYRLVPESVHGGLNLMFNVFSAERKAAFADVCAMLGSADYAEKMTRIKSLFDDPATMQRGSAAGEASAVYARRMVLKRYRKVAGLARSIDAATSDAAVHALRIECKKLRYLLEFFTPLFPPTSVRPLVKSLKGLQDALGRFNDCSVQRETLAKFVQQHPMRGKKGLLLAESIGALTATLYQLQLKARGEVEKRVAGFADPAVLKGLKRSFNRKDT